MRDFYKILISLTLFIIFVIVTGVLSGGMFETLANLNLIEVFIAVYLYRAADFVADEILNLF